MGAPAVSIDIQAIEENARSVVQLCGDNGIAVTGVTKVTCGMPQVARALIRGGVESIGESRMENIHRLRAGGLNRPVMLLRIPPLSAAEEIVRGVDLSLNSEVSVIRRLAEVAESLGVVHNIMLMVDLGDLREGILPEDLPAVVRQVRELPGVAIRGFGTNLTCYGGVIPTVENMQRLVDLAHLVEDRFGFGIDIISGGNSSSLPLLAEGNMPKGINNLRIGEAILLGRETIWRRPWPGTSPKAFVVSAELIERKRKPSVPIGRTGQDAFGHTPVFEDRGERVRGILNIGREDLDVAGVTPEDPGVTIAGASSDHLLVDLSDSEGDYEVGAELRFLPGYSALLAAMTSNYVEKRVQLPARLEEERRREAVLSGGPFSAEAENRALTEGLRRLGYTVSTVGPAADPGRVAEAGAEPPRGGADDAHCDADAPTSPDAPARAELARHISRRAVPILAGPAQTRLGLEAASRAMAQFGLLWVDATVDPETLGLLLGETTRGEEAEPSGGALLSGALNPENIVIVGPREIPAESGELIRRYRIPTFTMEEVSLYSMREVMRQALSRLCAGTEGIYLKFADRVADNGNEGLTSRETHLIMEMLAASRTLRVLEVDAAPAVGGRRRRGLQRRRGRHLRDPGDRPPGGSESCVPFLLSAMGKRILGKEGVTA